MLVLTRKPNEEILIADNIRIVIIRLKNGSVQIGIDAPREINVRRSELANEEAVSPRAQSRELAIHTEAS